MCRLTSSGLIPIVVGAMNHYWSMSKPVLVYVRTTIGSQHQPLLVVTLTTISCYSSLLQRLLPRVLSSIQSAKASRAQLLDMPRRRDTQDLRFVASIPLIQRRGKIHSREGKSAFTQWFFRIYICSLKDQVCKSKYPRTQILEPRTQPKFICHSSTTFIPTRSNNLIEVTS